MDAMRLLIAKVLRPINGCRIVDICLQAIVFSPLRDRLKLQG